MNDDFKEIIMLILGAALGLISSFLTIIVQRIMDRKGKLNVFYKFTNQKGMNGDSWGFYDNNDGYVSFILPIVYEFQNTSNTSRAIRDMRIHLYKGESHIAKMKQLDLIHITTLRGSQVKGEEDCFFGTDKGSYSFVIQPRSIQRQECEYMYKIGYQELSVNMFDTIVASYYDEKNKIKYFRLKKIERCWDDQTYQADDDWKRF